jgi:SAM-dependent methyltransferase
VNLLLDLHDTSKRLLADAGAITTPTLVLAAGSDWVVRVDAQQAFYEKLSSPRKQFEVFPGMYHAMLHESDRQRVVDRARTFIDECFEARRRDSRALLDADRGGYTRTEFDRLRVPASCAKWRAVRAAMQTVGRLSDGIRLGFSCGFDSGLTLDYVYGNRPRGVTPLGRLIDRSYLNSIGWRGIRQRRVNLEALLRRAMHDLDRAGRRVHVLDIAAGPGRYVLETLAATPDLPATATLRDYKPANIDAAKQLVVELGLLDRVRVQPGDAFDRASLAATNPKPTIGIVSGLYELFPDNAPLRESLAGLADAMETGGYLIYTCQPWHPQLEFIARALPNREGQPWIMRRRTQAEMDALVRAAGFEKVEQRIDRWGIFTVSLAQRI